MFAGQKVVEETLKVVRIESCSASDKLVADLASKAETALKKIRLVSVSLLFYPLNSFFNIKNNCFILFPKAYNGALQSLNHRNW